MLYVSVRKTADVEPNADESPITPGRLLPLPVEEEETGIGPVEEDDDEDDDVFKPRVLLLEESSLFDDDDDDEDDDEDGGIELEE